MASIQASACASLLKTNVPSTSRITPRIFDTVISLQFDECPVCYLLSRFVAAISFTRGVTHQRQGKPEGRALTGNTIYAYLPLMLLNNSLADIEAKAKPRV